MEFDLESALARLKTDFIAGSIEKLDNIDEIIDNIYHDRGARGEQFFQLQRDVHSIKGSSGTHGMHFASLLAHRLEDYLEACPRLTQQDWRHVQIYIDEIRDVIERGNDPTESEKAEALDRLPHAQHGNIEISQQKKKKVTILIVMPTGLQRKLVGAELAACGFDLSFTDRPVEAIRLVMELGPDAVISNQEFRNMTGVELGNALQVIRSTQKIPFALLTSYSTKDKALADLPQGVHLIQKGEHFIEDLTEYLVDIGLFGKL